MGFATHYADREERVEKARVFSTAAHKTQTRRSGEPYIIHPDETAKLVAKFEPNDPELQAAAWLHDVLEDTKVDEKKLRLEFGDDVVDLVKEVTNAKEDMVAAGGKRLYLIDKMNKMSDRALILKLCDRLSNVSHLEKEDQEWAKRYAQQTAKILVELKPRVATHRKIINLIWDAIEPYQKVA